MQVVNWNKGTTDSKGTQQAQDAQQGDRFTRYLQASHRAKLRPWSGILSIFPMGLVRDRIYHKGANEVQLPIRFRSPKGSNGLPRAGKVLIEDGIPYLWDQAKNRRLALVLWTVTLPTRYLDGSEISEDEHKTLLKEWAEITRRLLQELKREQDRAGIPAKYLYCVEPQEKRWKKYKVFAPHIHCCLLNAWDPKKRNPLKDQGFENSGYWALEAPVLDQIFARIVSSVLGKPVDCSAACNIEHVKGMRGLFEYMAKFGKMGRYLSKGSQLLQELKEHGWGSYLPSNWYGSDKETRRQVRASQVVIDLPESDLETILGVFQQADLDSMYESDRPLFRGLRLKAVEDLPYPVALSGQVNRLSDIPRVLEWIYKLPDLICQSYHLLQVKLSC